MDCTKEQLEELEEIGIVFSSDPFRARPSFQEYLLYFNKGDDIFESTRHSNRSSKLDEI